MADQFQDYANQYQQLDPSQPEHQAKFTHELASGFVAYEAAKKYEEHCAANGQPETHERRDELLAGFAGAVADREFETRGLDFLDRQQVQNGAFQQLKNIF